MKRFLPKSAKNPKGFTLVELLVVVSIIAILSVIGVTVFTGIQKGARDTKRKGDVEAMAKALESNFTSTYPTTVAATYFTSGLVPTDPQATRSYTTTLNATGFVLCAQLENSTGNASNNTGTASAGGIYYCAKNAQ